jgi:signal transduction histidine kinase
MPGLPDEFAGVRRNPPPEFPTATLNDVDIRRELDARPRRSPDYEREQAAFALLAAELTGNPRDFLPTLARVALDLCKAHTAGVSLLEGDEIREEAVAGVFATARGTAVARHESPSSVCIERDQTQLMYLPDRCFRATYADPRFVEMLLVPFHDRERAIGTVWIASHSQERQFDREDERIVSVLGHYASAGRWMWTMRDAAVDSDRRNDRLLAFLGHELRNPLAAIEAAAAVLEQQMKDPHAMRAVEVIARQTRLIERLAGDLLDRSRLVSGKLRLQPTPVDLWQIVAEAVDTCRPQIERRQLRLSVELPQPAATVHGDPVRLTQIFSNLIDNAAKFTSESGQVTITGSLDGHHASVSIRDNGIGIPRDQIQRVFEPFAQLPDVKDDPTSASGLGLGLSLVRSLAELHRGTVTVLSDGIGRGSCFTVRLPLHAHHVSASPVLAQAR